MKKNTVLFFLLFLFTFFIYPNLYVGGELLIPGFLGLMSAVVLMIWGGVSIRVKEVNLLLWMMVFFLSTMLFVPGPTEYLNERITGVGQIIISVFIFYIVKNFLLMKIRRSSLEYLYISIIVITLILSMFEVTGLSYGLYETVRDFTYSEHYKSIDRDLSTYGLIRPMVFAKEPAHLAYMMSILIFCWFAVAKRDASRLVIFLGINVVALVLIRSPVLLVGIAASLTYEALNRSIWSFTRLMQYVMVLIVLSFLVIVTVTTVFKERVGLVRSGGDLSATARVVGPPLIAKNVIKDYPIYGVGFTADTIIYKYVNELFMKKGMGYRLRGIEKNKIAKYITNYFWLSFIYMGIVGSSIFYFFLFQLSKARTSNKVAVLSLMVFVLFGQAIGGLVSLKVWISLAMIITAVHKSQTNERSKNINY